MNVNAPAPSTNSILPSQDDFSLSNVSALSDNPQLILLKKLSAISSKFMVLYHFVNYYLITLHGTSYCWTMLLLNLFGSFLSQQRVKAMTYESVIQNWYRYIATVTEDNTSSEQKKRSWMRIDAERLNVLISLLLYFVRLLLSDKNPVFVSTLGVNFICSIPASRYDVVWAVYPIYLVSFGTALTLAYHGYYSFAFSYCFSQLTLGLLLNLTSFTMLLKYTQMSNISTQLKEAVQAKSDFVSNISHEFRSPLLSVNGSLELIEPTLVSLSAIAKRVERTMPVQPPPSIFARRSSLPFVFPPPPKGEPSQELPLMNEPEKEPSMEQPISKELFSLVREQRKHMHTIKCCSNILLALIEDVLQFAKLDKPPTREEYQVFSLKTSVERIRSIIRAFSKNSILSSIEVTTDLAADLPEFLVGDELRIQQICINLLTNALKASKAKDTVSLSVSLVEANEESLKQTSTDSQKSTPKSSKTERRKKEVMLLFKVKDQGKGIPKEKWGMIFNPFTRIDSNRDSSYKLYPGTGLGLTICKKMVTKMGGQISFDSSEKGTTFFVKIPFAIPDPEQINEFIKRNQSFDISKGSLEECDNITKFENKSQFMELCALSQQASGRASSRHSSVSSEGHPAKLDDADLLDDDEILLAEDNPVNKAVLTRLLVKGGFTVRSVSNGQELVEEMRRKTAKVIVSDYHMPLMDGVEAAKIIKGEFKDTKFVLLTADAFSNHSQYSQYVDLVLIKPITGERLCESVRQMQHELEQLELPAT